MCILIIHSPYFLCLESKASDNVLQKYISFVEQRLKFSHFKGNLKL